MVCGALIPIDLPQPPPVILNMDITQAIFPNHNAMVLEMNYKKIIIRLEFGEVSGHRVLIKRGPGNRGPTECGTTHEATSGMSS